MKLDDWQVETILLISRLSLGAAVLLMGLGFVRVLTS